MVDRAPVLDVDLRPAGQVERRVRGSEVACDVWSGDVPAAGVNGKSLFVSDFG